MISIKCNYLLSLYGDYECILYLNFSRSFVFLEFVAGLLCGEAMKDSFVNMDELLLFVWRLRVQRIRGIRLLRINL